MEELLKEFKAMRDLDLVRAKEQPESEEYYFGRAHRMDDVIFKVENRTNA